MVCLRPPEDRDAHRVAAICADPEVARWTRVPSPYTLEDARGWIALAAVERGRDRGLQLVAVRAEDDRVVGAAALRLHDHPERGGEVGYSVAADARRAGVATCAVRLLTDHAFGALSLPYVELAVAPANEPSRALACRAGFTECRHELRELKGELSEFEIWRKAAPGDI